MERNGKKRDVGTVGRKKEHGESKLWSVYISSFQFSKLRLLVEAKLITMSDVALDVSRGNISGDRIINDKG